MNYNDKVIDSQKELKEILKTPNEIYVKAKFGPSQKTRIPLILNEELSFFVATIIGDGHLKKSKYQINLELSNKNLLKSIKKMCLYLFNRSFNICKVKERVNRKQSYSMCIDSKAIHQLLNQVHEIPIGKKSHIVKIPKYIFISDKSLKAAFLIGIMVTEGGKRRRGFGLSTASKQLWEDLVILFNEVGIKVKTDKWTHKKYKKQYYGISFKKEFLSILKRECRSGQTGQILSRCNNLREGYA